MHDARFFAKCKVRGPLCFGALCLCVCAMRARVLAWGRPERGAVEVNSEYKICDLRATCVLALHKPGCTPHGPWALPSANKNNGHCTVQLEFLFLCACALPASCVRAYSPHYTRVWVWFFCAWCTSTAAFSCMWALCSLGFLCLGAVL